MTALLVHLEARRAAGAKLLIPYVMSGIPQPDYFPQVLQAAAAHADAIEVGLPYSDPLMDGPVIASAGERVLRAGIGPLDALDLAGTPEVAAPRVTMTYYNPIHAAGEAEFCKRAAACGISGLIVPDLPVEESDRLRRAAADEGIAWVGLVAPTSSQERVGAVVAASTGFVYAVSTLGVTGTRARLSERFAGVVAAAREATDLPVVVGIGVSDAEQAVEACRVADGVVIGSAVIRLVLEQGAEAAGEFLAGVREALDSASS